MSLLCERRSGTKGNASDTEGFRVQHLNSGC